MKHLALVLALSIFTLHCGQETGPSDGLITIRTTKPWYTTDEYVVYHVVSRADESIVISRCDTYPKFYADSLANGNWQTYINRGTCPSDDSTGYYVEVSWRHRYVDSVYITRKGVSRLRIPYTSMPGGEIIGELTTEEFSVY